MLKLKLLIVLLITSGALSSCSSAPAPCCAGKKHTPKKTRFAKIVFSDIKDLLIQLALTRSENAGYRELYLKMKQGNAEQDLQLPPAKSIMEMIKNFQEDPREQIKDALKTLAKQELELIVETEISKDYDIVLYGGFFLDMEGVLHSKYKVKDITPQVLLCIRGKIAGAK